MAYCGSCTHFDKEEFPYNEPCRYCGNEGMHHNGRVYGTSYYEKKRKKNKSTGDTFHYPPHKLSPEMSDRLSGY